MSTANYLNVKTHLSDLKCGSDKDTISEASESGTTNSLSSSEDLQKLAVILGLQSAEDVYQERFRVDRRRLECMLADNLEESQTASGFFHQIMSETNTLINWPARLKIGARSKKDPHVRVAGRCEDVRLARERIMQLLDTRSNRVTMKVDVSYTDHSHIIGKGGLTIKRVMEETGCHIHFPDSNRSSANEKSNQVSVAGDMDRVEKARARVRALTPLIFSFELPIMSASKPVPDVGSPYALQIQEKYNVQVMLRTRPKLHATLVVVKGVQWEVQNTMEATKLLVDYMCGSIASQTLIQMSLEISPIHHDVVLGANANQLKVIMKNTGAQIMFPDAGDPNIPPLKKSNVTITGSINDVYMARQQLVGSLPLVVIFDMPEEGRTIEQDLVSRVMQTYNVNIQVRRKLRQGLVSVVIKGVERCAGDIYEARRELLGGNEPEVKVDIPESYHIPAAALSAMADIATFSPFSPSHANVPQSPLNCSPMYSLDYSNYPSPIYHHNPPTPGGYPSPMSPVAALSQPGFPQSWAVIPPSPQAQPNPFPYPAMPVSNANSMYVKQGTGNSWNAAGGSMMSRVHQQMLLQQYQHQQAHASQQTSQPSSLHQLLNISGPGSSGYQSNFTGSTVSLDTHSISGGDCSNVVSPSVSPISNKTHSPTRSTDTDHSQDIATMLSELTGAEIDRRAVGCEKKTLEHLQAKLSPLADYHKMKSDASKAMQEEIGSGYRVPTTRWSGYYFSHTSPSALKLGDIKHQTPESKPWNKSDLVRPNIAEMVSPAGKQSGSPAVGDGNTPTTPTPQQRKCHYQQLSNLLADIGLLKYVELFQQHEIDISTFASLNEADLAEIGVTAFGARRKMLLTIADLKQQRAFKPPGPSAQRKLISSPPQYNTEALQNQNKW